MIWSGGLREKKKTKREGGGKGGGGGGTKVTSYKYYASFALCIGRGPADTVRKIWADGKLIYDGTGGSNTKNDKYKWRLLSGAADQAVDPLISESINRRLAGLPDINAGNGPQTEYTTMDAIIAEAAASPDPRTQMYAQILSARYVGGDYSPTPPPSAPEDFPNLTRPEFGLATGELFNAVNLNVLAENTTRSTPSYGFTPAYRGLALLVFDNMYLADFGNRIPNITAEVVWGGASEENGQAAGVGAAPVGADVTQINATAVPSGFMVLSGDGLQPHAAVGNVIRRFNVAGSRETRQGTIPATSTFVASPFGGYSGFAGFNPFNGDGFTNEDNSVNGTVGGSLTRLLGDMEGDLIVGVMDLDPATPTGLAGFTGGTTTNRVVLIDPASLSVSHVPGNPSGGVPLFGTNVPTSGAQTNPLTPFGGRFGEAQTEDSDFFAYIDSAGVINAVKYDSGVVRVADSVQMGRGLGWVGLPYPNIGPMSQGAAAGSGAGQFLASASSATGLFVGLYTTVYSEFSFGRPDDGGYTQTFLELTQNRTAEISNPFSADIDYISAAISSPTSATGYTLVALVGGGTGIIAFTDTLQVIYSREIVGATPPIANSGLSRSDVSNNTLAFASGRDIVSINLSSGTPTVYEDALTGSASANAQVYIAASAGLLLFEDGSPRVYRVGNVGGASRDHDIAALLSDVVTSVCRRAGMSDDEFDVSSISPYPVRGYSIARQSTARSVLDQLSQAFFVDGVESDWIVKFADRSTNSLRTIEEQELGEVNSPTGKVNWLESRSPEHDLPAELNLNYSDPVRDYQTSTAYKRRISDPVPSMYSDNAQNIEYPIVFKDYEAANLAERLLFLSWMSRDSSKSTLNWTHIDIDPNDVISYRFTDGRVLTDRIAKMTIGANFEIDVDGVRSGDPVYETSPFSTLATSSIPSVSTVEPVPSEVFVLDTALLTDFHETNRASAVYYVGAGTDSADWSNATIFAAADRVTYEAGDTVVLDLPYGSVAGILGPPRAAWTTDYDNTLTVALSYDSDALVSVTREEILNGANKAFVYNRDTGNGEIIQFQNVDIDASGLVATLSVLTRGLRGTEGAAYFHGAGETFVLLDESGLRTQSAALERLGSVASFKAVTAGQLISEAVPRNRRMRGRSLFPYAPSRVRRSDDGSDLTISWNRRTRVGGGWDMVTPSEVVPLSEDYEEYELFLLRSGGQQLNLFSPGGASTYLERVVTQETSHTFTATQLAAYGLTLDDDINVVVYQVSAQVGRGHPASGPLTP